MRPTPEGVGNVREPVQRRVLLGASMRPTPEGVGNDAAQEARTTADRGFNEAHARRRGKCVGQGSTPS